MLLTLDAGNTNLDLGLFEDNRLLAHGKVPTPRLGSETDCRGVLADWLGRYAGDARPHGAAVGSVVAGLGARLVDAARGLCDGAVLEVRGSWDLGLTIRYDDPERVGVDRVAAAAAAFADRPSGQGVVVADAGTAITVDAVDAGGTFLGGLILPGLRLGLTALGGGTSLLPQVSLDPAASLLGRSTPTCLQAGALHGGAALLDGLFERIVDLLGTPMTGYLTGGDGPFLAGRTTRYAHHDPALVLRGLRLAYLRRTDRSPGRSH